MDGKKLNIFFVKHKWTAKTNTILVCFFLEREKDSDNKGDRYTAADQIYKAN
jgi:hypothetical protein